MGVWIPVTERVPDDFRRVLVWWKSPRTGDEGYGFGYLVEDLWYGDGGVRDRKVIAWTPLPEKYDGGGQNECKKHS